MDETFVNGWKIRTVIRGCTSDWRNVTSGMPQGSVLASLVFQVYINDFTDWLRSHVSLFVGDAKVMKKVMGEKDSQSYKT